VCSGSRVLTAILTLIEDKADLKNLKPGQVTLMHLLLGIAFCIPIGMAMTQVQHSGGGMLCLRALRSAL
jgi:hypothetical protein